MFTFNLITENSGHPGNQGLNFEATHPVVRTNPVTGWKSLFGVAQQIHDGKINGLTDGEEESLKTYFLQLVTENHSLQVRFRWSENDIAVWDQKSTVHTATMVRVTWTVFPIATTGMFLPSIIKESVEILGSQAEAPMLTKRVSLMPSAARRVRKRTHY